jgi:predicted GNAT superfamily acetyltransferase
VTNRTGIVVRPCSTPEEFRRCVDVEEAVWHFNGSDAVSHHILAVAHEIGGHVFGAFDGARMIGFAFAFPAIRDAHIHLHSHMAAVIPEYQDRGVGRMLKLAQREDALARAIDRIEWTFDPLQIGNANFNINRLGAIVRRYIPNFYGESSSPLHANLPTDRLVAEWILHSDRVRARIDGVVSSSTLGALAIAIPKNMNELRKESPPRAAQVQAEIREKFLKGFEQGFAVTGFGTNETHGTYYLERWNAN